MVVSSFAFLVPTNENELLFPVPKKKVNGCFFISSWKWRMVVSSDPERQNGNHSFFSSMHSLELVREFWKLVKHGKNAKRVSCNCSIKVIRSSKPFSSWTAASGAAFLPENFLASVFVRRFSNGTGRARNISSFTFTLVETACVSFCTISVQIFPLMVISLFPFSADFPLLLLLGAVPVKVLSFPASSMSGSFSDPRISSPWFSISGSLVVCSSGQYPVRFMPTQFGADQTTVFAAWKCSPE